MNASFKQQTDIRSPAKTKTELREMLAEAVRNTQPKATQKPKAGRTKMSERKP